MSQIRLTAMAVALSAAGFATTGLAQQAQRPQIETTKVDGTDNVYIFRNGNHQSMFIVTKDGVIATDPIAYGRPTGGQDYIAEIKKVTDKPIKFLIYSHHHYDHIAGGKPFKDAGATIIAHKRAKERLAVLKDPNTPLPDQVVSDTGRTIKLGGTTLELKYFGLNHSDSNLVMWLPKEKIVHQEGPRVGLGEADPRTSRPAGWSTRHQEGCARHPHADAGGLRRDEKDGARRQMLGAGREGLQAAEIRELARL